MLIAAGYAPLFPQRSLDDPDLEAARAAVERLLSAMEPYPALAIDRHWNLIASNAAVTPLLTGVDHSLITPPINVLRLSLHPQGIAPRIVNLSEWRAHLLARLRHQIDVCGDAQLSELLHELADYPQSSPSTYDSVSAHTVAVPLRLAHEGAVLSFISTTTVFGTPVDVTLSEMALECFYPADAQTEQMLQASREAQSSTADANRS